MIFCKFIHPFQYLSHFYYRLIEMSSFYVKSFKDILDILIGRFQADCVNCFIEMAIFFGHAIYSYHCSCFSYWPSEKCHLLHAAYNGFLVKAGQLLVKVHCGNFRILKKQHHYAGWLVIVFDSNSMYLSYII